MISSKKKKKKFRDLPPDAREACKRFIEDGVFENEQEYVDSYFEDEPEEENHHKKQG